jgi:hypothetical protein
MCVVVWGHRGFAFGGLHAQAATVPRTKTAKFRHFCERRSEAAQKKQRWQKDSGFAQRRYLEGKWTW